MTQGSVAGGSPIGGSGFARRQFLIRSGLLGAAVALADVPGLVGSPARAAGPDQLAPLFDAVATDTINGLVAFVVPGNDEYSKAQGQADSLPGGIAAKGTSFMLNALDNFYPVPQQPLRMIVASMATALSDQLPDVPVGDVAGPVGQLDDALAALLDDGGSVPLSALVALLLNVLATTVDPASLQGSFTSPFSNLSFASKAAAFQMLEEDTVTVSAMFDSNLSEPLKESFSGLLAFLGGALLEFAAFGSYSEWSGFDPHTRKLTGVPVGWRLSKYLKSTGYQPVEGWDEFKGYYQGRRRAHR
jgi:hypothetical protein